MLKLLTEFAGCKNLEKVDSAIVIILSHGRESGAIAGVDGPCISDKEILNQFVSARCPLLQSKPKIFIIGACRGGE